ncbi:hypothetical protein ABFS83_01G004100 [Erythranthe nasuta]
MVVKVRKWTPWPPSSAAATRKFQVAVKPLNLEVLFENDGGGGDEMTEKFVAIKMKWKGEPKFFPMMMTPFQTRPKREVSRNKIMEKGRPGITLFDDDQSFENTCCFSVVSNNHDPKFGAWEIAFNVLYGEKTESKAKMGVIGRVNSVNISEIAWKMDNSSSSVEQKLPLSLHIDGFAREAALTVLFNFVEIRESQESATMARTKSVDVKRFSGSESHKENMKARRRSLSQEEVSLDEPDESSSFEARNLAQTSLSMTKSKEGWFSWKNRRFSFKRAKTKLDVDPQSTLDDRISETDNNTAGAWEEKELISRDGQVMLKASVFFASFDQRSDKAAGESACTALVAVIAHWLHSNSAAMPNRFEFNDLIKQGSSEWRKLCEDASYVNKFPDKHFDLETVLRADIRPLLVSHKKSFVGLFGAEIFESLKEAMSFDDIWDQISSNNINDDESAAPRIYIVSWNDHFFVLKAETDAYYIIDTLGERLFEGCQQAYILRFDDKTLMQKHVADKDKDKDKEKGKEKAKEPDDENGEEGKKEEQEQEQEEEIICSGKECCREFIKRFLAAIPLKELEEEEKKKGAVSHFSLHQRLQIEFNYSYSSSPLSSLTSSPFSPLITTTSQSSPISE